MQTTNSWSLAMNSYPVTPNSDPMGPNLGSLEFWSIIFFNFLNVENSTLNSRWRIWKIYAEKMFLCWVMDDCRNLITDWPLIHTQWPLIRTQWVRIRGQSIVFCKSWIDHSCFNPFLLPGVQTFFCIFFHIILFFLTVESQASQTNTLGTNSDPLATNSDPVGTN